MLHSPPSSNIQTLFFKQSFNNSVHVFGMNPLNHYPLSFNTPLHLIQTTFKLHDMLLLPPLLNNLTHRSPNAITLLVSVFTFIPFLLHTPIKGLIIILNSSSDSPHSSKSSASSTPSNFHSLSASKNLILILPILIFTYFHYPINVHIKKPQRHDTSLVSSPFKF